MTAATLIALLNQIATLEPVAFSLVKSLITGLMGKSDADILAGDASDWMTIIATAHAAAQANPPSAT
jgi:uncharacterized membrane protein